ncbi:hypothetical protein HYR69_12315 [Candidatus Sumerlaeota bacterium]|nr:hypothetical protein [Candidatus Sumerlaeota bacterium]
MPKSTCQSFQVRVPVSLPPATEVFDTYWRFAAERQVIFFNRLRGAPGPWTDDAILRHHKFTNAYRASDRVSQFLIRRVIYDGDQRPEEIFFRILLFKFFNRIDTWQRLTSAFGSVSYRDYSFDRYDHILSNVLDRKEKLFSAAYIMPSGSRLFNEKRKHRTLLKLLDRMMEDEVPSQIASARSMQEGFAILRSYPLIGDFLAYQYITDINYSTIANWSEMEFTVAGPGARDGIAKCFGSPLSLTEEDIIRLVAENQTIEFERRGLHFQSLWGRPLQLIDCQNLFCEVDKYSRIKHPSIPGRSGRTRIKQRFTFNPEPVSHWYPPKWGINEKMCDTNRKRGIRRKDENEF